MVAEFNSRKKEDRRCIFSYIKNDCRVENRRNFGIDVVKIRDRFKNIKK